MSYGFEAINGANSVMVSDEHQHLAYFTRGFLQVNGPVIDQQTSGTVWFPAAITTSAAPKIFLRMHSSSHSSNSLYCVLQGGPGNWTGFTIFCGAVGVAPAPNFIFEYVVGRFINYDTAAQYGMVIYGPLGNPIFTHDSKLVKYSKFTKLWTMELSSPGFSFYNFYSNLTITAFDFIDVSSINRGCITLQVWGTMFTSLTIWRNNAPTLQMQVQSNSNTSSPQYIDTMRFCMAVCEFPSSIYY